LSYSFFSEASTDAFLHDYLMLVKKIQRVASCQENELRSSYYNGTSLLEGRLLEKNKGYTTNDVAFNPALPIVALARLKENEEDFSFICTDAQLLVLNYGLQSRIQGQDRKLYSGNLSETFAGNAPKIKNKHFSVQWSPCGFTLAVVERSSTHHGIHATARVHLFVLINYAKHGRKDYLELQKITLLDLEISAFSISNNLWIGPRRLLLPDPSNCGNWPSVLLLNYTIGTNDLEINLASDIQGLYDNFPAGMLTAIQNGYSAFVTYCDTDKDTSQDCKKYLGDHEHHRVVILDKEHQRSFEVAIPGLVLEMNSFGDCLGILYREHVAVVFAEESPSICEVSKKQPPVKKDTFYPHEYCVKEKGLQYRSYPDLDQPATRSRIKPSEYRYHRNNCPLTIIKRTKVLKRRVLQTAECLSAQRGRSIVARSQQTGANNLSSSSSSSSSNSSSSSGESDAEGEPSREKKRKTSKDRDARGLNEDCVEGRISTPVVDQQKMFYAEINVVEKKLIYFSGEKLNAAHFRKNAECTIGIAYEATNENPKLNQIAVMNKHSKNHSLIIDQSCVYLNTQSMFCKARRIGITLARNHPDLPASVESRRDLFFRTCPVTRRHFECPDLILVERVPSIRTSNPVEDKKHYLPNAKTKKESYYQSPRIFFKYRQ